MKTLIEVINEQQRRRPPHDDPFTDHLIAEIIALAEEVCVLRDRQDTSDRLTSAGKLADKASVDAFEPDAEILEQRLARHREFFKRLFSRLGEAATSAGP